MSKILCECGEQLWDGQVPSPIMWRLIADEDFERFAGQVDAQAIYTASQELLRCPNCDRLWIRWNKNSDELTLYRPADER